MTATQTNYRDVLNRDPKQVRDAIEYMKLAKEREQKEKQKKNNIQTISDLITNRFMDKVKKNEIHVYYICERDFFAFWNGKHYSLDEHDIWFVKIIMSIQYDLFDNDEIRRVLKSKNDLKRIKGMIQTDITHHGKAVSIKDFNRFSFYSKNNSLMLNCQNAVVHINFKEGVVTQFPHEPENMFLSILNASYKPEKMFNDVYRLMAQIVPDPDDQRFLRTWYLYSLMNGQFEFQMAPYLYGAQASNGKSTLANMFGMLFPNVAAYDPTVRSSFNLQHLLDADLIICDDINPDSINRGNISAIKKIISGEGNSVDIKNQTPIPSIVLDAKVIFTAEHVPDSQARHEGIKRRLRFINCPNVFHGDALGSVLDDVDPDQLLNLALDMVKDYDKLVVQFKTEAKQKFREFMRDHNQPVKLFLLNYVEPEEGAVVYMDELYQRYKEYAIQHEHHVVSRRSFGRYLSGTYKGQFVSKQINGQRVYEGIRFVEGQFLEDLSHSGGWHEKD